MAAEPGVPDENITVVLVEDHALYRKGLRAQFELDSAITVIAEFDAAAGAVAGILELRPAVVLMDLHLPWTPGSRAMHCGARVIAEILQAWPEAKIAVITMFNDDERVREALKAGALSYLSKDGEPHEVIQLVRLTAQGIGVLNRGAIEYVKRTLPHSTNGSRSFPELGPKENELLALAAAGNSDRQIAEKLGITTKTVANKWSNIRNRLGIASRDEAVRLARAEDLLAEEGSGEGG